MSKDYLYITGYIRKAEDILNYPGTRTFRGEDSKGYFSYDPKLNALNGYKSILFKAYDSYDYVVNATNGIKVRSDWIDSLDYDVDWELVPIDEVIEVSSGNGKWYPMHFASYDPNNPNEKPYFTFKSGRSSETALNLKEKIEITLSNWENLSGKYILLYSKDNSYYIWFNLDEGSSDPGASGGPLYGEGYTGIEISISTGEPADSIAEKVGNETDSLDDFDSSVSSNVVTIEVSEYGKVYDASNGTSELNVVTRMQGGDVEAWSLARPII